MLSGCLCTFLRNYNTLVTSKIGPTFLIGNILRYLITALEIHDSSGYCFMDQNMENIDFHTLFEVTSQPLSILK